MSSREWALRLLVEDGQNGPLQRRSGGRQELHSSRVGLVDQALQLVDGGKLIAVQLSGTKAKLVVENQ